MIHVRLLIVILLLANLVVYLQSVKAENLNNELIYEENLLLREELRDLLSGETILDYWMDKPHIFLSEIMNHQKLSLLDSSEMVSRLLHDDYENFEKQPDWRKENELLKHAFDALQRGTFFWPEGPFAMSCKVVGDSCELTFGLSPAYRFGDYLYLNGDFIEFDRSINGYLLPKGFDPNDVINLHRINGRPLNVQLGGSLCGEYQVSRKKPKNN